MEKIIRTFEKHRNESHRGVCISASVDGKKVTAKEWKKMMTDKFKRASSEPIIVLKDSASYIDDNGKMITKYI